MSSDASDIFLLFPNQLFEDITLLKRYNKVYLLEEPMFFGDKEHRPFNFNKVKLAYMVACMRYYNDYLKNNKINTEYITYSQLVRNNGYNALFPKTAHIHSYLLHDIELERKLSKKIPSSITYHESPYFLLSSQDRKEFHKAHPKGTKHTVYYKYAKGKLHVLEDVKSQDKLNRENLPKTWKSNFKEPNYISTNTKQYYDYASDYVDTTFASNIGSSDKLHVYPITFKDAKTALDVFLKQRFALYGQFQDAMHTDDPVLYHSFVSAPINIGILTPSYVLQRAMAYAETHKQDVPIQSLEGFVRQLIWREYEVYIYETMFDELVKSNHFNNTRNFKNWDAMYTGTTGIAPLDDNIKVALTYGYCHHIVRLMVFLNLMTLSEISPFNIYRWFMEVVAIDAYPWVMYSNIYTMGYANTKMMVKPYISTSAYIRKMSNYKKGPWCEVWDALFYRFLHSKKQSFKGSATVYLRNLKYFENKTKTEQSKVITVATRFLDQFTI